MKANSPLLSVRDLVVKYRVGSGNKNFLTAVNGVSLDIHAGSIFGLVGESGSGKTSLAHSIMQLVRPAAGEVLFHGENLAQYETRPAKNTQEHPVCFPGSPGLAQPAPEYPAKPDRAAEPLSDRCRRTAFRQGPQVHWKRSGWNRMYCSVFRMNCPAGRGSAWHWPGRWSQNRN